jgi:hypothetical protein
MTVFLGTIAWRDLRLPVRRQNVGTDNMSATAAWPGETGSPTEHFHRLRHWRKLVIGQENNFQFVARPFHF